MRLDTANRAFVTLLAAAVGGYLLIGVGACLLLCLLGYQVAVDGWGALTRGDQDLRPAAVFLGLVAAGTLFALWSLGRQLLASRRLARRIRTLTVEHPPLGAALERAGLAGRVDVVDTSEPFSFAYGVVTPRVALSRGLVDSVTPGELEAVLEHERYHVQNLDPLKVVLARALPRAFFYLPALGALRRRYVTARELAADRRALSACGRAPLAGALFKVVRGPDWPELSIAAAIGGPELLDVRVAQLETGGEPRLAGISRLSAVSSMLGVTLLIGAFAASVTTFGGPAAAARAAMPGMDLGVLNLLGVLACLLPWIAGGWLLYHWLKRSARRGERHGAT